MPGYLTTQAPIFIEGAADLIIRSLLDRQQFADADGQAEALGVSSAAWPLFGMLWPSAVQLAGWMARYKSLPMGITPPRLCLCPPLAWPAPAALKWWEPAC